MSENKPTKTQKVSAKAIIGFCDRIVKKGDSLSIHWSGGNDSGDVELKRNDGVTEITNSKCVEQLLEIAQASLGYYGFDGNFYTEGEAYYDAKTKCFTGTDSYSHDEPDVLRVECTVELPAQIWFDRLDVSIENDKDIFVEATPFIANGPIPPEHQAYSEALSEQLRKQVVSEVNSTEEYVSVWDRIVIPRSDFEVNGDVLKHTIKEINCTIEVTTTREININLNNI